MKKQILDHGYLELCDSWGSDEAVIRAARMSTDKGFLGWGPHHEKTCAGYTEYFRGRQVESKHCTCSPKPGDEKLLRYLWENEHSTPFEFGGLTIEVQAPIAVFREWHRHRVPFGYSELSARYTPMPDLNYVPTVERCMLGGGRLTKQAAAATGSAVLTETEARTWRAALEDVFQHSQNVYDIGLKIGIPKELARGAVTVFRYSRMRATGNLRGWLAFCRLRCAPQAQWEIRQYANEVGLLLAEKFPRTWELYQEGVVKRSEEKRALKKLEAVRKLAEDFHDTYYRDQLLALLEEP